MRLSRLRLAHCCCVLYVVSSCSHARQSDQTAAQRHHLISSHTSYHIITVHHKQFNTEETHNNRGPTEDTYRSFQITSYIKCMHMHTSMPTLATPGPTSLFRRNLFRRGQRPIDRLRSSPRYKRTRKPKHPSNPQPIVRRLNRPYFNLHYGTPVCRTIPSPTVRCLPDGAPPHPPESPRS